MQFPMATVKKNALYTTWMRNATSWWDTFDVPKNWKEINRHKRISLREIATQLAQVRSAHDQWPTLWQLTSVNLWICDCDWHYQFMFFFYFSLVFSLVFVKTEKWSFVTCVKIKIITEYMRLRRMQHSGTHCVAFFGTRGRQGIRHPRSRYIWSKSSTLARPIAHARRCGCLEVASHHENENWKPLFQSQASPERATLVKPPWKRRLNDRTLRIWFRWHKFALKLNRITLQCFSFGSKVLQG
jgi:hypothetical protein